MKYTIPVNSMTRKEALKSMREMMSKYHEDVEWVDTPEMKRKEREKKLKRIFNGRNK